MGKNNLIIGGFFLFFFVLGFFSNVFADSSVIFHGDRDKKEITLTLDVDMTKGMKERLRIGNVRSWYNKDVIAYLEKTKTPATLFLTGMWVELYPNITKELSRNSLFELANHSYSHPSFNKKCYGLTRIDDNQKKIEIVKTQKILKNYQNVTNFFRFPGGCYSKKDERLVEDQGLRVVQWDVVGGDSFATTPQKGINNILYKTQNGSIIVLHMHGGPNASQTALILKSVIPQLKKRGFAFVKLSQLHV